MRLRFVQKPDKDSAPLRDGTVDLETGVVGKTTGPEVRAQALFRDRFIGVVRMGHPLSQGEITPARYAAGRHICVSRRGLDKGPIDEALKPFGLEREIVTIVGGFSTALALARASDLIASVPERHTGNLRAGMHSFPASGLHAGDHGFIALAPAAGCRSGASLAARVRSGRLRGATHRFIGTRKSLPKAEERMSRPCHCWSARRRRRLRFCRDVRSGGGHVRERPPAGEL